MTPQPSRLLLTFKHALTVAGQWFSPRLLFHLQSTLNYLKIGQWMAARGFQFKNRVQNRRKVWDVIAREIGSQPVLYLEFGVAGGESIRYWAENLKHPESILHGFDSFEGMPETGGSWNKGQFSTGGKPPEVNDPRVRFFKGWFDQVLPTYSVPAHSALCLNLDADLYSSTIYVLQFLRPHIKQGTFIYFDEMNHPEHEVRAFDEFLKSTGLKFRPVAGDQTLTYVAFQCVG